MLGIKNFIISVALFFFGYITSYVVEDITSENNSKISQGDSYAVVMQIEERLEDLSAAIATIQYVTEDNAQRLVHVLDQVNSIEDINASGVVNAREEYSDNLSMYEAKQSSAHIKEKMYDALYDVTKTLPDILSSQDMEMLSPEDKNEFLTELARKIDSGEIDKTMFLPGYK